MPLAQTLWNNIEGLGRLSDFLQWTSWGVVILGAVVGVLLGISKHYVDKQQKRLIALQANERAAVLENSATLAKLELENIKKKIGPRQLKREAFLKALKDQPRIPVEILYLRDDPDSLEFAQQIEGVLKEAKWEVRSRDPIPTPISPRSEPTTMSVGGQPSGVTVAIRSITWEEMQAGMNRSQRKPWVKTPWTVLTYAFEQSMGESKASAHPSVPEGIIRIIVGPRP